MPHLTPSDLADWWAGLPATPGDLRVLAVEGRSGSGKTTLAAALSALVPTAARVPMDELYPGWDGLAAAVDLLLEHVLVPLAAGRPAAVPRWDWTSGTPAPPRPLPPPASGFVLLEGIGCGARACAPYLGGLVWIDAPAALRRERALARDGATYAPHWERWAAQEVAYLAAERPDVRADLVLDGSAAGPGTGPGGTGGTLGMTADRRRPPAG